MARYLKSKRDVLLSRLPPSMRDLPIIEYRLRAASSEVEARSDIVFNPEGSRALRDRIEQLAENLEGEAFTKQIRPRKRR